MLKSEKGISLVTAVMSIMIMVIILATLTYTAYTNVKVRNLNKLYNDIRTLNDEVAVYYLKNGTLPIDENTTYTIAVGSTLDTVSGELDLSFVTNDGEFTSQDDLVNPNDYDNGQAVYYKLDLGLFDNITLSYTDEYIINAKSHTIYYVDGIKTGSDKYYCIPLAYEDVKYNESHPVTKITTTTLYLPMGGNSINLKNGITFYASDGTATGVPKTITYTVSGSTSTALYDTSELSSGILTSTDESNILSYGSSSPYVSFKISLTNYDGSTKNNIGTVTVYFTDLIIGEDSSTQTDKTSEILLASSEVTTVGYIHTYGKVGTRTATYATSGEGTITAAVSGTSLNITPTTAGKYIVTVSEANGKASKDITIYVLNPSIDSTSLTFASLNESAAKTLNLTVEGLEETGLDVDIEWSLVDEVKSGTDSVVTLATSDDEMTATVTPTGFGTVYIQCTVTIDGESDALKTFSIPVTVTGITLADCSLYECDTEGTTSGDSLSALDSTTSQTGILTGYDVDSNLGTKDTDYTISWSSSDEEVATIDASTGIITAVSSGTTTITATVTKGTTTYSDTFELTVN